MDTPLKDPSSGWGQGSGSHPWRYDGDYDSTLYLKNLLDKPSSAIVQVSYKGGVYLPNTFSLKPHQTIAVNLNQLASQQKKDIHGNLFPSSAKQGRVKWIQIATGSLVGRVEISNPKLHYAGSSSCGACSACSQYQSLWGPSPSSATDVVGDGATQYTVPYYTYDCLSGQSTGPYTSDNTAIYWTSDNSSVVSITTSGLATPVSPGTANIFASTSYTGPAQPSSTGTYDGCTITPYYESTIFHVASSWADSNGVNLNNLYSAVIGYGSMDRNGLNNVDLDPDAYNYLVNVAAIPANGIPTIVDVPNLGPIVQKVAVVAIAWSVAVLLQNCQEARGQADPEEARLLPKTKAGTKDANGNCNPGQPLPNVKWQAVNLTGPSVGLFHWHWYN